MDTGYMRLGIGVTSVTVFLMFLLIHYGLPLFDLFVANAFPGMAFAVKSAITVFATFGIYRFIAIMAIKSADVFPLIKRLFLGNAYMHGTWVGRFKATNDTKWTVEHFEQSLESLVIRGWASNPDGTLYAQWTADAIALNAQQGVLTYTYNCDLLHGNTIVQGVCVFQLERGDRRKSARRMSGYSADLSDGVRSENNEIKISDKLMPWLEAVQEAKNRIK